MERDATRTTAALLRSLNVKSHTRWRLQIPLQNRRRSHSVCFYIPAGTRTALAAASSIDHHGTTAFAYSDRGIKQRREKMVALWDVLGKAANLAQLSGLDAIVLVTAVRGWLKIPQNKHQCRQLEDRVRFLRGMLQQSSATVRLPPGMTTASPLHGLEGALEDADRLVASYKNSSLWSRVRWGRRMAGQFHEMLQTIDSYLPALFFVTGAAYLLMQASYWPLQHPWSAVGDPEAVQRQVSTAFNREVRIEVNDGSESSRLPITYPGIHMLNIRHEGICSEPGATASGCEIMPQDDSHAGHKTTGDSCI